MKTIIVFYSFEGNTRLVSEAMAKEIGADILEIKPEKEMKSKGFMKFVWGGRQAVMGSKPKLAQLSKDLDLYDRIVIGTPVWAGRPAPPIKTLMEDHLPAKRKLALFYTYEGGEGVTLDRMEEMKNGGDVIAKKGFMSPLKGDKDDILAAARAWAKKLP
jgi:flavodoxin